MVLSTPRLLGFVSAALCLGTAHAAGDVFKCTWHKEEHAAKEIGFALPDAAMAMTLPENQRRTPSHDNEDVLELGDARFIRGWAPVPVKGRKQAWGFGFWVQVAPKDYADFRRHRDGPHPEYPCRVANQSLYGAPVLGMDATLEYGGRALRPLIRFKDATHPLTAWQQNGVEEWVWRVWLSDEFHAGEPQRAAAPVEGTLTAQGWEVMDPAKAGKKAVRFAKAPKAGDAVKVLVGVSTADHTGATAIICAGWWVRLDDVARPGLWSGTVASPVRIQTTLAFGSRVWLKPEYVLEHEPAAAP